MSGRLPLFPTTLVGSYPQPDWLIDRAMLAGRLPPRVRAREIWRIPAPFLEEAQNDATRLAIREQEEAGLDILTDGEVRRESYSNRFASAFDGIDFDHPATVVGRSGLTNQVPRIVGRIARRRAVEADDVRFLRAQTTRRIKMTVPGPFTMVQQAVNEWYGSEGEAAMDYAAAVNAEVREETPEIVAARIRRALPFVAPERIIVAPDCGMKYLPRDVAFAKMCAMVEGARIVRRALE